MKIHQLDNDTIGKIAAGEVIERPASVAKELVENSLDALANEIDIEIRDGGQGMIRIRDNGHGIDAGDLALSIQRHATSKVASFEDLMSLTSYGFRGEALASIAAVSDFELASQPREQSSGARLRVRFGNASETESTPMAPGTTITVRDLFANVPARAKFLRKPGTEVAYIQRAVHASAVAFPDVRFRMTVDGKTTFRTDGAGDPGNTIVAVFGAEITADMVQIQQDITSNEDSERPPIIVEGYISSPSLTRGNRQGMIITVNNRWIESRQITVAIEQAYHTLIMAGRFPYVAMNISVPADRIDVNVHPTKREIRFSDDRLVFAEVQRAVRGTLMQYGPGQDIPAMIDTPLSHDAVQRRLNISHPERYRSSDRVNPVMRSDDYAQRDPSINWGRLDAHDEDPASQSLAGDEIPDGILVPTGNPSAPVLRVLGQVGGNYIIAEGQDGMYLIDQHAAHERVLFEQLLAQYQRSAPDSQGLLDPIVIELTPDQSATFERCHDDLYRFGFEVETFGETSVAVRAVPAVSRKRDPRTVFLTMLDEIASGGRGDSITESLAISAACHSSIRAGQTLSLIEMRELVMQLERCSSPRACGHGRPTMLHMSQDELERQFERR